MNLGQFTDQLQALRNERSPKATAEQSQHVRVVSPSRWFLSGELLSYRGYYDQLALGFTTDQDQAASVEDILKKCKEADGSIFQGYKGGDYVMTRETNLWLSNYGTCSSCRIVGVANGSWDFGLCVILGPEYWSQR